jgi:hypothetical protein
MELSLLLVYINLYCLVMSPVRPKLHPCKPCRFRSMFHQLLYNMIHNTGILHWAFKGMAQQHWQVAIASPKSYFTSSLFFQCSVKCIATAVLWVRGFTYYILYGGKADLCSKEFYRTFQWQTQTYITVCTASHARHPSSYRISCFEEVIARYIVDSGPTLSHSRVLKKVAWRCF